MNQLLNYTPHRHLSFYSEDGVVVLPPQGNARAAVHRSLSGSVDAFGGVPLYDVGYGAVDDLPDPREGVFLVVSMLVAQLLPERRDLVFPDDLVRDADGSILGFRSLGRVSP